jgi:HSP20 family protein
MTISAFDPFSTFDRVLSRMGQGGQGAVQQLSVPMDVYRAGDEFVIEADVPGVDPSTIDMTVERNMVTIAGEVHARHQREDELLLCERPHAKFRRQVYLGDNVDTENIKANYDDGVLTIRIPVTQQQRARKIEVGSSAQRSIDVSSQDNGQNNDADDAERENRAST